MIDLISIGIGAVVGFVVAISSYEYKRWRGNERRAHQNRLILSDLENWMGKTRFTDIGYRDGELNTREHRDPELPHFEETTKILENRNAYTLWINGIETSNNLKKDGKEAIGYFHTIIDEQLEPIPLKKSLLWSSPVDSYVQLGIRRSIFDGINNINDLNLRIENRFLHDGGSYLAEGEKAILVDLKKIIENLINNEILKEKIKIFNESKEKLDNREPFKKFKEKLDDLIKEYGYTKIY